MSKITAVLLLLAAPANAGGLIVKDCAIERAATGHLSCIFTNNSTTPIAAFTSEITISEKGRTVPWITPEMEMYPGKKPINGGLEPNETANILLRVGYLDARANLEKLVIDVVITGAFDVNGAEITN
jgi:hypothetical protein